MTSYLVDASTGLISSTHEFPMEFSISGHSVINIPTDLDVVAETNVLADLLSLKLQAFKNDHVSLSNSITDEYIVAPNVDAANSSSYNLGGFKKTILRPGGVIVTNPIAVTAITTVFADWYGFQLASEPATPPVSGGPPGPDRLLYNYDSGSSNFEEFNPSTFTVELLDAGTLTPLLALTHGVEQALAFGPSSLRVSITNTDPSRSWYISDWTILYD